MKISNPFQKNYRFILGIIFTVLEGFLSASVYMTLYLLILLLVVIRRDRLVAGRFPGRSGFFWVISSKRFLCLVLRRDRSVSM